MASDSEYYTLIPNLKYDKEYLKKFLYSEVKYEDWYEFNCGKIRWTVKEDYNSTRTECSNFQRTSFFEDLYKIFNIPINYGDVMFSKTPPPGVPPHIDRNRPVAINFPIIGNFHNSPITWYSNFSSNSEILDSNHFTDNQEQVLSPMLFNPQKIHGVKNKDDYDRCILTVWWRHHSYKEVLKLLKTNELFNLSEISKSSYWSLD